MLEQGIREAVDRWFDAPSAFMIDGLASIRGLDGSRADKGWQAITCCFAACPDARLYFKACFLVPRNALPTNRFYRTSNTGRSA